MRRPPAAEARTGGAPERQVPPVGVAFRFGPRCQKPPECGINDAMKISTLVRTDCVHFKGEKPCKFKRVCDGCPEFQAFGPKVLVIKCRAQGDVLRTTPVLTGIRRKHPDAFITWVVDAETVDLLKPIPLIDRVLPHGRRDRAGPAGPALRCRLLAGQGPRPDGAGGSRPGPVEIRLYDQRPRQPPGLYTRPPPTRCGSGWTTTSSSSSTRRPTSR